MIRSVAVASLALALTACDSPEPVEDRAVRRWLLCEECVNGELDSVLTLGSRGQKAMERALNGPPRDRLDTMRRQIEAMYDRIQNPAISRQAYLDHYLGNYISLYKSRATVALVRINTPSAHAALVNAMRPDTRHREDVRLLLGESVGSVVSKVAGDNQNAPRDSFLRVDPTIEVVDSTTRRVMSNVRTVFRVDSGGGTVADSVRLTNPDGRATVRWQLGSLDSTNVLVAVAAGRVVRFHALAHPPADRIVFLVQPSNGIRGQPITPPVRFVVQNAWGETQTNVNGLAIVTLLGTNIVRRHQVVAGMGEMPDLRIQVPGRGFKLQVNIIGASPASSSPFDISP